MAPPFGVIDLSALTSVLVDRVSDAFTNSHIFDGNITPFAFTVSGLSPDAVRKEAGCQLSIYLFHVDQDPHQRNAPVTGPRVPTIPFQPMSLNLYYLVTAYSEKSYIQEQQAMSVALLWFYEHPVFSTVINQNEYTLTMQPETADTLGRLWQSTTAAARLSVVYRVAVVFLPTPAPKPLAKPVESYNVVVDPAELPFASAGQVTGTTRRVSYRVPAGGTPHTFLQSPAAVAPGQHLTLWGSNLGVAPSDRLYLLTADGATEHDVTAWVVGALSSPGRLTIELPATAGVPPAGCPDPGVYQFRVGNDGAQRYRSSATPFAIAPRITPAAAADPVVLQPGAGTFTVSGSGFSAGATDVLLETVPLRRRNTGDPLDSGDFDVDAAGATIHFRAPATLAAGDYAVRVRVNQIDADPAWWIHV